jgi:hypothetical protein
MPTINANSGAYTLIGATSVTSIALICLAGSYALSGTDAGVKYGHPITADAGSYAITGQGVQSDRIAAEPAGYLLDGQAASLAILEDRIFALSGTYAITGSTAILEKAITYNRGSYAITGIDATISRSGSPVLPLAVGSYAITGTAAGLQHVYFVDEGDYNATGTAAAVSRGKGLSALTRSYAITNPSVANLRRTYRFIAATAAYNISGPAATLLKDSAGMDWQIAAEGSFYTITGNTAVLAVKLNAASGSYAIVSVGAGLRTQYDIGSYSITGQDIDFFVTNRVIANSGVYTITGQVATLIAPTVRLELDSGIYVVAGFAKPIVAGRLVLADISAYAITGTDAFLRVPRILIDSGAYGIQGDSANIFTTQTGRWKSQPVLLSAAQRQAATTTTWDTQPEEPGVESTTIQP